MSDKKQVKVYFKLPYMTSKEYECDEVSVAQGMLTLKNNDGIKAQFSIDSVVGYEVLR